MENLDYLVEHPTIFTDLNGNVLVDTGVVSNREDEDPVFGFERTSEGTPITGDYDESMEKW